MKISSEHFLCVDNFGVITMLSFRCNFGRINPYKSHWNPIAQSVIIIIFRVSHKQGVLVGMLKARHSSYGCPRRLGWVETLNVQNSSKNQSSALLLVVLVGLDKQTMAGSWNRIRRTRNELALDVAVWWSFSSSLALLSSDFGCSDCSQKSIFDSPTCVSC